MAEISKVQLPSGGVYDIKDSTARQMISGGVSFNIVWTSTDYASTTTPTAEKLATVPAGVKAYYNSGANYGTGTLAASADTVGKFYLVYSKTQMGDLDTFDEYATVGPDSGRYWEKIGDTQINLSDVVTAVSLNKQTDVVLGEGTTFTASSSAVTFSGGTNDKVLGEATTFALTSGSITHGTPTTDEVLGVGTTFSVTDPTISLGGTTKYLSASASGGGAAWNSKDQKTVVTGYASPTTDTFVKSVSAETNKNLVTTTVPNVTSAGSASTWTFTMGTGDDAETLIIGGNNSTAPTLGTAITVATGATSTTGTGDAVVTGVTIGDSATAITGLGTASTANVIGASSTFTNTQPTVSLTANASSASGRITYLESASPSASGGAVSAVTTGTGSDKVSAITAMPTSTVGTAITVGTNDKVTAITGIGTGTAAAQTITVGTNDKVTALTSDTSLTVTKGNA